MGWVVAHMGPSLALDALLPVGLVALAVIARRRRDTAALLVAAAAVALAVLPPVGEWAERSVTGHMVQHLVLVLVAAPALALPLATTPSRLRRRPPVRRLLEITSTGTAVALLGTLHAATMVAVHVPVVYDAALASWPLHAAGHLVLLGTGMLWIAAVIHHVRRAALVAPIGSLVVVATSGAALGAFMMFAPAAVYADSSRGDQQLAGALMGVAGAMYAATGVALAAQAIGRLDAPRPRRFPTRVTLSVAATVALSAAAFASSTDRSTVAAGNNTAGNMAGITAGNMARSIAAGQDLYRRDCAWCHGVAGEGTANGPDISEVGTASVFYAVSTGRMPIDRPDAAVRRGPAPYSDEAIRSLVDYTSSFVSGPDVPNIGAVEADLSGGGTQYRLLCAACHGATGEGGAQAAGSGAPSVLHARPDEIAAAIVAGPGQMPSFGTTLGVADVASVTAYVEEIQDPTTTGVALPGGRVGEGLVAWLVLATACLGFVAWTGRRV
jgi:ubiquinol-cytochrome c reductase cytochrome c subunit